MDPIKRIIPKLLSVTFPRYSKRTMCLLQRKPCNVERMSLHTHLLMCDDSLHNTARFTVNTIIKILGSDNVYVGRNVLSL